MSIDNVVNLQSYKNYKEAKESGKPIPAKEAAQHDPNAASVLERIANGEIPLCEPGFDKPWTQDEKDALAKAIEDSFS